MPVQRRVQGRERTAVRQRSGPIARAGQAGGGRQRQRPGRDRERQVPGRVERPGIAGPGSRCRRPTPPRRPAALTGGQAKDHESVPADVPGAAAETSEVLPCGSVAVAVMIGKPAGAVNGTAKIACRSRRSSPPASPGNPRPRPSRRDRRRRWRRHRCGRSCPALPVQPALELAAGGGDDDREVLEVVRALARSAWRWRSPPSSPRSMACPGLPKIDWPRCGRRRTWSPTTATPDPEFPVMRLPGMRSYRVGSSGPSSLIPARPLPPFPT